MTAQDVKQAISFPRPPVMVATQPPPAVRQNYPPTLFPSPHEAAPPFPAAPPPRPRLRRRRRRAPARHLRPPQHQRPRLGYRPDNHCRRDVASAAPISQSALHHRHADHHHHHRTADVSPATDHKHPDDDDRAATDNPADTDSRSSAINPHSILSNGCLPRSQRRHPRWCRPCDYHPVWHGHFHRLSRGRNHQPVGIRRR